MDRRVMLAGLGAATVAAGALYFAPRAEGPLPLAAMAQDTPVDKSLVKEMTLGEADAPLTVVEYASFTCPHCANFHKNVFGQLKANYIDTGKIRFVYREVYFDRFGLWAGLLARCGDGTRYFGIADLIYEKQADWTAGGDPATIASNLRTLGKTAGLSDEQLDGCLSDGALAQAMVAVFEENAARDGIDSTPSFLIDGEKYSNMSYQDFAKILDGKLGG